MLPFVFVFSPSLLIVANGFTLYDFLVTFVGCVLGISLLAACLSRFLLVEMRRWEQLLCAVAAILMVYPGLISTLTGAVLSLPVLARQWSAWRLASARVQPAA